MRKKKIFIEIEVPEQVKKYLGKRIEKWSELPIKWTKMDNLHVTVSFVGYVDESMVPEICLKVKESVSEFESFEIIFNCIKLLPDSKNPQTVSLSGDSIEELGKLNEVIEEELGMHPQKHKMFFPHVTLGRIRKTKWDLMLEKPTIQEKCNLSMTAEAVLVMESQGGDAGYSVMEHCELK